MGHELSIKILTFFDVQIYIAVHWRPNLSNIEDKTVCSCSVNIGVKIQVKLRLKLLPNKDFENLGKY